MTFTIMQWCSQDCVHWEQLKIKTKTNHLKTKTKKKKKVSGSIRIDKENTKAATLPD